MKKLIISVLILMICSVESWAQCRAAAPQLKSAAQAFSATGEGATSSSTNFSIVNRGAATFDTVGGAGVQTVGYARVQASGGTTPSSYLTFQFKSGDILVGQASVPAVAPTTSARIYAEVGGPVNTGVAIANPNSVDATISFSFTDAVGNNSATGSFKVNANTQMAKFLDQSPFNAGAAMRGTMTMNSTVPVAMIALRGYTNERGEFLITTLPVTNLPAADAGTVYMPHFADGGGWTTQVVLVNPTDFPIGGSVQFYSKGEGAIAGSPLTLTVDGQLGATFSYSIPAKSSARLATAGFSAAITGGSIRVVPGVGNASPSAVAIFSFRNNNITVSEAGVPALSPGNAFRIYEYDCGDYKGQIQTGVAITNPGTTAANVTIELTDKEGLAAGLTASFSVPPGGQVAKFMREFIPALPYPFHGVARITSSTSAIAVTALRGDVNSRGDFLITTALPTNEASAPTSGELIFPHLVDKGGYTTEFVLFSGVNGQVSSGVLRFYAQDGSLMTLNFQ